MKKTYNPENDDEGLQFMAAQEKSRAKFGTFFANLYSQLRARQTKAVNVIDTWCVCFIYFNSG